MLQRSRVPFLVSVFVMANLFVAFFQHAEASTAAGEVVRALGLLCGIKQ